MSVPRATGCGSTAANCSRWRANGPAGRRAGRALAGSATTLRSAVGRVNGSALRRFTRPTHGTLRGEGLLLGFDLVEPKTGSAWATDRCRALFDAALRRGLITMAYAPRVRINPPLVLRDDEADEAIDILDAALAEVGAPA